MRRLALLAVAGLAAPAPAQDKQPPYWASIIPSKARTRAGPGREFPAVWLYQRKGLPVRVVATYPNWRKVADPDGATGWMQANMLTVKRTAMVRTSVTALLAQPDGSSRTVARAQPGVIGELKRCDGRWCLFETAGRRGWLKQDTIWGAEPGESFDD